MSDPRCSVAGQPGTKRMALESLLPQHLARKVDSTRHRGAEILSVVCGGHDRATRIPRSHTPHLACQLHDERTTSCHPLIVDDTDRTFKGGSGCPPLNIGPARGHRRTIAECPPRFGSL